MKKVYVIVLLVILTLCCKAALAEGLMPDGLEFGMSKDEACAVLGEPSYDYTENNVTDIEYYGRDLFGYSASMGCLFQEGKLCTIGYYNIDGDDIEIMRDGLICRLNDLYGTGEPGDHSAIGEFAEVCGASPQDVSNELAWTDDQNGSVWLFNFDGDNLYLCLMDPDRSILPKIEDAGAIVGTAPETDVSSLAGAERLEGSGFDTPEEAVLAYLDAMNRGDAGTMLSTFAIESFAFHNDPEIALVRLGSFSMNVESTVPKTGGFSESIIAKARYGKLAQQLMTLYVEANAATNGAPIRIGDGNDLRQFTDLFETGLFNRVCGRVEFVGWVEPYRVSQKFVTYNIRSSVGNQIAALNAQDYTMLAAHIRIDGVDAVQMMSCIEYNGRWYNSDMNCTLSYMCNLGTSACGLLYPFDDDQKQLITQMTETEADPELIGWMAAVNTSDLVGTEWRLAAVNNEDITVWESPENIRGAEGNTVCATLRFARLGVASLTMRFSPSLDTVLGGGFPCAVVGLSWMPEDGTPVIEKVSGKSFRQEEISCVRNGDTLMFRLSDDTECIFRRVAWE